MKQDSFIVTEELIRATEGSFEQRIALVSEALQEHSEAVFGSEVRAHVLATFEDSVLVVTSTGGCHRVRLDESNGVIEFGTAVPVSAKLFAAKDMGAFVKNEATDVVDRFLRGDEEDARRGIQGLIAVVEGKPGPTEDELITAILSTFSEPRPWKRIYESKDDKIKRFVLNELVAIDENTLRPKFRKLHDGSMDSHKVGAFRDLVESDTGDAIERFIRLADSTKGCFEAARSVLGTSTDLDEEIVEVFSFLAEDLTLDLCNIRRMLSGAHTELNRVDCLGKLHDALAESFYAYEVASCFVAKVSNGLRDTAEKV